MESWTGNVDGRPFAMRPGGALPLRNVGLMVLSRCCGRSGCRTARLLTSPAGRCEETPRTSQKTATPRGEGRRAGKGLVRIWETGARDSRAAHQSGDACGSAIGRAIPLCYRNFRPTQLTCRGPDISEDSPMFKTRDASLAAICLLVLSGGASGVRGAEPVTRTFDVRPIVRTPQDVQALADLIPMCVASASWADVGGDGTIKALPNGRIDVTNSEDIVGHVERLLTALGADQRPMAAGKPAARRAGPPPRNANPPVVAEPPEPVAIFNVPEHEPLLLKTYDVSGILGRFPAQAIEDRIRENISVETWDSVGGPGTLRVYEPTKKLVILQTAGVHQTIVQELENLAGGDRGQWQQPQLREGMAAPRVP